jgi:hypothetical protein
LTAFLRAPAQDGRMVTVAMVVLALATFLAMIGFIALCDRV